MPGACFPAGGAAARLGEIAESWPFVASAAAAAVPMSRLRRVVCMMTFVLPDVVLTSSQERPASQAFPRMPFENRAEPLYHIRPLPLRGCGTPSGNASGGDGGKGGDKH